jgi:hypothetical protein
MWKLLLVLGILLDLFSVLFIGSALSLPAMADNNENAQNILNNLLCREEESYSQERYTRTDSQGTSTNTNMYCDAANGERRNVTGTMILMVAAGFTIPFLLGLGLIIGSSIALARRKVRNIMADPQIMVRSTSYPITPDVSQFQPTPQTTAEPTLTEKLQQVEDALARGLITPDEYNAARKRILED